MRLSQALLLTFSLEILFRTPVNSFQGLNPVTVAIMAENGPSKSKESTTKASSKVRRCQASSAGSSLNDEVPLTIGLLADIQYAPVDDGHSYSGTPRYYRHALAATEYAAKHFEKEQVELVVNLGDIADGLAVDAGISAVEDVMAALSAYTHGPIIHAYGNHCLYNMDRQTIQEKLGIPFVTEPCGDLVGYSSQLHHRTNIRFLVLDSYDIALLQRCAKTSQKRAAAVQMLETHNAQNYAAGLENSPDGLEGVQKRFVAFNGAVGEIQLRWLRQQLKASRQNKEKVVLLSHQPILPESTNPVCLMWNYEDVLGVLRDYGDVVTASFSGHAHKGGYSRDEASGIHFRVFEAVLESNDPDKTYALIDLYTDRIEVRGYGHCQSAVYMLDHEAVGAGKQA